MTCRERLEQWLNMAGVKYDVTVHPVVYTAQEVAASEHLSGYEVAKVVMAIVDGDLVMLVLPAPHRVDLAKLRSTLGAGKVRLAGEQEFANLFPDCDVGAMPPFGNLYGISVYLDPSLAGSPQIIFNAGTHRETITMPYADFERLVRPQIVDLSTEPGALKRPA